MNMIKTILFCSFRSTDNRFVEMKREFYFPGFVPIGYDFLCSPDEMLTVRYSFYVVKDECVHAVMGDSGTGEPLERLHPDGLLEVAVSLHRCGFTIADDRPPDGEPTMASILAAKEQP